MVCHLLQFFNKVQHGVVWGLVAKLKKTATTFATILQQKSNTPKPLFISLLYHIFSICCNVAKILQQITHSIFSQKYRLTGLSPRFVKNSFILWPIFQQNRADTSQKTRKLGSIARTLPILQGFIWIRMRFLGYFCHLFKEMAAAVSALLYSINMIEPVGIFNILHLLHLLHLLQ